MGDSHFAYIRGYHPDEPKAYRTIINFPEVYLTTNFFQGYGTTVQFIVGLFLLPFKLIFVKLLGLKESYAGLVRLFSHGLCLFSQGQQLSI